MMEIDIITIFPEMFNPVLGESMLKIAQEKNLVKIRIHDLRRWSKDKHRKVDDRPFGGGPGMVMKIEPIYNALEELKKRDSKTILLSPQGTIFKQRIAESFSKEKHLIFICGHYEGVDERVRAYLIDEEISIGDYVLTCGELPAMVVVDAVVRLIPGVLGSSDSLNEESFSSGFLEYPQYTRPASFKGWRVPAILLSGDHKKIVEWRKMESMKRTHEKRPDLWDKNKKELKI
ncbi:MAG: tRNA (guanosine(37)-N1)-methyltransferase TrmD [Candidatus Omnitrophica bacterium]|nr:tRNA (guanosine(37)-N1)-methyltransferase TrmD [Candidatus Omnitrophota bacterium]